MRSGSAQARRSRCTTSCQSRASYGMAHAISLRSILAYHPRMYCSCGAARAASVTSTTSSRASQAMAGDPLWFKDAVIYEAHVRAFQDSNGDGIGDFKGLTSRLDYIQDLGVNTIWLLPFYPSPGRDDGYDISDYYDIHPSYGTREDFKTF